MGSVIYASPHDRNGLSSLPEVLQRVLATLVDVQSCARLAFV
jgi:hypothetical protein